MKSVHPLVAALACAATLLLAAQSAEAAPTVTGAYANRGAGVCLASDGNNSNLDFTISFLRNKSNSIQYVTCNIGFLREKAITLVPDAGFQLAIVLGSNSAIPQNVSCTAAVGTGGAIGAQTTKSGAPVLGVPVRLDYSAAELKSFTDQDSLTITCGLAPGTAIGLVTTLFPRRNVVAE